MKPEMKKIIGALSIVILICILGSITVSATGLYNQGDRPSYNDLINKWNEIQNAKQDLRDTLTGYGVEVPDLTTEQKKEILFNQRMNKKVKQQNSGIGFRMTNY